MQFFKNLNTKQRIAVFSVIFVVIGILIYSFATMLIRAGKIPVTVHYAPYTVKITLGGVELKNRKTNYLPEGTYTLTIEAEHFETITKQVTISSEKNYLVGVLSPTDEEGEQYQKDHAIEFANAEGLVGEYLNKEGEAIKKQYPILAHLPYNNSLYSISYDYEDTTNHTNPVITIKAQDQYMDVAVAKLKDYADDTEDNLLNYRIYFSGNTNNYIEATASTASDPLTFLKQSYNIDNQTHNIGSATAMDDYYVATLYDYNFDKDLTLAHYRVVLQKNNDSWQIVNIPQPYLTTYNTPDVPAEVLNTANSL